MTLDKVIAALERQIDNSTTLKERARDNKSVGYLYQTGRGDGLRAALNLVRSIELEKEKEPQK